MQQKKRKRQYLYYILTGVLAVYVQAAPVYAQEAADQVQAASVHGQAAMPGNTEALGKLASAAPASDGGHSQTASPAGMNGTLEPAETPVPGASAAVQTGMEGTAAVQPAPVVLPAYPPSPAINFYDGSGNLLNAKSLREIWDYLSDKENFSKGETTVSYDDSEWAYHAAQEILTDRTGDSIGLAAAFAMFVSEKGYEPQIICGKLARSGKNHALVYFDGSYYDPGAARDGIRGGIYAKKKYPLKIRVNRVFHYNLNSFQTGICTIAGHTWYFTGSGKRASYAHGKVVRNGNNTYFVGKKGITVKKGWVIRGGRLYCFKGKHGAGLKSRTYQGIRFTKNGLAADNVDTAVKMKMLKLLPRIVSRKRSKSYQLYQVYRYMSSHAHFHYEIRYPNLRDKAWAKKYANYMLSSRGGNCYGFAATFSAFANELGYKPVIICGRIHGRRDHAADGFTRHAFVRINGRYYDPEASWAGWMHNIYNSAYYPMTVKSRKAYKYRVKISGNSGSGNSTLQESDSRLVLRDGVYSYVDEDGNKQTGAYIIKNKLYIFDEDGDMEKSLLADYQELIREKSPLEALKEVLGEPDRSEDTGESCYDGNGTDCIHYYPNITVYTFRYYDGNEIVVSATAVSVKEAAKSSASVVSKGAARSSLAVPSKRALRRSVSASFKAAAKNGLVKRNGYIFGYSNGRMLKNTEKKISGKTYYFTAKGRGFLSLKNAKANKAAAAVFDHVKFTAGMSDKKKLQAGYRYILNQCSYLGIASPELSGKWYYDSAYQMSVDQKGKCYDYAALTYVYAKALGYKAKLVTGTCDRNTGSATEHAWVVIGNKYVVDSVFADTASIPGSGEAFFYQTYASLEQNLGYVYTAKEAY